MKDRAMLRILAGVLTATVVLGSLCDCAGEARPCVGARRNQGRTGTQIVEGNERQAGQCEKPQLRVRGLVPAVAPTGQYINLFASSRVVMQRPDKLFVEARGDMFPSDIFYNGKTITVIGLGKKFYVQQQAAGAGFDTFVQSAQPGSDAVAPFFDMLTPDPYATLTKDFLSALFVGQSTVGGVKADHLAFTAKGVDWEIWIGAADKLPRLMVVSYRIPERHRTFTVEFSDWKLNAPVPAQTFNATIPAGATKLEFKPEVPAQKK